MAARDRVIREETTAAQDQVTLAAMMVALVRVTPAEMTAVLVRAIPVEMTVAQVRAIPEMMAAVPVRMIPVEMTVAPRRTRMRTLAGAMRMVMAVESVAGSTMFEVTPTGTVAARAKVSAWAETDVPDDLDEQQAPCDLRGVFF